MTRAVNGVDYEAELLSIRENYVCATPRQRLSVIRQRLEDHHFGPNRLVTTVSAVEALARALAMNHRCKSKTELNRLYPQYRNRAPKSLVNEYLLAKGISDPDASSVQSLSVDPSNGTVLIKIAIPPHVGKAILLIPSLDADKRVVWRCRSREVNVAHLPQDCRG